MLQTQQKRMQQQARRHRLICCIAIQVIARNSMPYRLQMHPNLMRTPRLGHHFEHRMRASWAKKIRC